MTYYDFKHSRCTDIFSLGRDANPIYPINVTRIFHPDILRYCDKRVFNKDPEVQYLFTSR